MADTKEATSCGSLIGRDDWDVMLSLSMEQAKTVEPSIEPSSLLSSIPKVEGGQVRISYEAVNFKAQYVDEYTREPLPLELVKAAIIDELDYSNSKVWEVADARAVMKDKASKLVRTRWVICNKGDTVA